MVHILWSIEHCSWEWSNFSGICMIIFCTTSIDQMSWEWLDFSRICMETCLTGSIDRAPIVDQSISGSCIWNLDLDLAFSWSCIWHWLNPSSGPKHYNIDPMFMNFPTHKNLTVLLRLVIVFNEDWLKVIWAFVKASWLKVIWASYYVFLPLLWFERKVAQKIWLTFFFPNF